MIQKFISELPDIQKIIPIALDIEQLKLFYGDKVPADYLLLEENRQDFLLESMYRNAEGYDNCFYCFGDTPFLDINLVKRMYDNHLRYFADYSFADGYPFGLAAEIIRPYTLHELYKLIPENSTPVERDSLFSWIQKDINSFDIETEISPVDLRLKRISLSADNKINILQLHAFYKEGIRTADDFISHQNRLEEFTRTAPAYYQIQINGSCPQSCSYCPYPQINPGHLTDETQMDSEKLKKLIWQISDYTPEARISLSLWGEPSLYKDLFGVLAWILDKTAHSIVIETSGLGWDFPDESYINPVLSSSRIEWIFSLDAQSPDTYRQLRGEGQREALNNLERILTVNPDHCWVQAVRMKENEHDLEEFYRYWKERTENVIIQKYDSFCGVLEERKMTDLSPLKRFPCWHLKREMTILMNGDVILCREDLNKDHILGNCFTSDLEEIWEKGRTFYSEQLKGDYSGICRNCDEYYSYNF
ncbi:MAG: spiro-SPASM protein [Spirochaetales bacterium]|nr:spiro-SPASM protein [Spirochaetales bacterium]